MTTRRKERGGTAAALAAANETPLQRELYVEYDTGKMKVGNGVTAFNSLPYINGATTITSTVSVTGGNMASLSAYASLSAAVAAIGSGKVTLLIDSDQNVAVSTTVPANITLKRYGTAKLTKTSTGAITFQGVGIEDPLSDVPLFSGFAAGDITWTGASWPSVIHSSLWADTDVSARLLKAIAGFTSKQVKILASPGGNLAATVTVTTAKTVHLTRGTYPVTGAITAFVLNDNTKLCGDGVGQTFVIESSSSVEIVRSASIAANPFNGYDENIEVCDMTILGNVLTPYNSASSAIILGNTYNGHIRRMSFKDTHGFATYIGAAGSLAATFTDSNVTIATGNINIASHGRSTGWPIYLSTTGKLPVRSDRTVSVASSTDVSLPNTILSTAHGFQNGEIVRYIAGTTPIGGLTDGTEYMIAGSFANSFQLTPSSGGGIITFSSTGTGTQKFGVPLLRTVRYYVIAVDGNNIKLAKTKEDALSSTALVFSNATGGGTHMAAGYTPDLSTIEDIVCDGLGTQQIGFICGRNNAIRGVQVWNPQPVITAPLGVVIDIEPNATTDIGEGIVIENIWIDGRNAQQNWSGLIVQAANAAGGIKTGRISDVNIIGSDADTDNGHLIIGVELSGCEDFTVSDIFVRGAQQEGYAVSMSRGIISENITVVNGGVGGSDAVSFGPAADCFHNNSRILNRAGFAASDTIAEGEASTTVNTSGTTVTVTGGLRFYSFMAGLYVNINGVDYQISSVANLGTITLTSSAGTQTGVTLETRFGHYNRNHFSKNYPDSYSFSTTSLSVVHDYYSGVRDGSYAPAQITADVNEYNVRQAARYDLNTNASHYIGGLLFNATPTDGSRCIFLNVGSNNLVLKHLNGATFGSYQFSNSTGADITLAAGEAADLEYVGSLTKWKVWKR